MALTSCVPARMFGRMADNDPTLPEKVADALNTIEEFTGVNVKKATAKTARHAYVAQVAAIGLTVPLAVGGPATLSPEQARRPDESLPTQNQGNANPMRSLLVAASTSGESVSLTGLEMQSYQGRVYYVSDRSGSQDRSKVSEGSRTGLTPQGNADGQDSNAPET